MKLPVDKGSTMLEMCHLCVQLEDKTHVALMWWVPVAWFLQGKVYSKHVGLIPKQRFVWIGLSPTRSGSNTKSSLSFGFSFVSGTLCSVWVQCGFRNSACIRKKKRQNCIFSKICYIHWSCSNVVFTEAISKPRC